MTALNKKMCKNKFHYYVTTNQSGFLEGYQKQLIKGY
jgi:hypothetical protein